MGIEQSRYIQHLRSEIMNSKEEAIIKLQDMMSALNMERADGVQLISRYRNNDKIISLVGIVAVDDNNNSDITIVNAEDAYVTKDEFQTAINELKEQINKNNSNSSGNTEENEMYENYFDAVYNVTSINESMPLFGGYEWFSYDEEGNEIRGYDCSFNITLIDEMFIDGVKIKPTSAYTFSTIGEHEVKCTFRDKRLTNCNGLFTKGLVRLNLSKLDTSMVLDMSGMFKDCDELKDIDLKNINTSKVRNMSLMFSGCSGLTSLDLSSFNTSNVSGMSSMFSGCSGLTSLDLSNFDTSKVTNMRNMFSGCTALTSINLSSFDTSNVFDMAWMFSGCRMLNNLNVSNFNTSKVEDMSHMFQFCMELTSLDLSSFDTSNVTNASFMFHGSRHIKSLDLSNFDTSNMKYTSFMFADCTNLCLLKIMSDTSNMNVNEMFRSNLQNGIFIHNCAYDYTNIISALPSTWVVKCETEQDTTSYIERITIFNNEPGEAKVSKYNEEQFIFSEPIISCGEYVINGEMFSAITNTINIEYESNQWCSNNSCFVVIEFDGEGISPKIIENGVIISEMELNTFRIIGQTNGSCSGSVICDINDKHIIINIIFKGIPY